MNDSVKSNELDTEIREKKRCVERLSNEIKQLELEKSKQDSDYIGRFFEMTCGEYVYVEGKGLGGDLYGISFQKYEYEVIIDDCYSFEPKDIEAEIDEEKFKEEVKNMMNWNSIKNFILD